MLAALTAWAAPGTGVRLIAPGLTSAILAAALVDAPILRVRTGAWRFPSGAVLTGWLIAMVLSPHEPWYVGAVTSAIAIVSKYVARVQPANIFNPAALALVVTFYLFDTGQSWWGALPDAGPVALAALLLCGAFITDRVNKFPLVLTFLGGYFFLFSVTSFVGDPKLVSEIFRTPDAQAAVFFAFFILTDPPTTPVRYRDQVIIGAIVAAVSYLVFEEIGAAYYLLAGVLAGNVWEAGRRVRLRRSRQTAR